jgi:hypothetical protein
MNSGKEKGKKETRHSNIFTVCQGRARNALAKKIANRQGMDLNLVSTNEKGILGY